MEAPTFLNHSQAGVWLRTVKCSDSITQADRDVLAAYCVCVDLIERLTREAESVPLTCESSKGTPIAHPIHRELRDATKELRQLAAALRLTPASRTEAPPAPQGTLSDLASRRASRRAQEGITA